MNFRKSIVFFFGALSVSLSVHASNSENWETFSDIGAYSLVGVALIRPVYMGDWEGFRQAGYSIATASGVGLIGKYLVEKERPDKSGNDSFPSNHTANSFASATTLNLRYGWKVGFPAYGMATLVGVGRIQAEKHDWVDVLAGAAIGSLAGWVFTDAFDENVRVVPWAGRKEVGVALSVIW